MTEKLPKIWVLADWEDGISSANRDEFGPYFLLDISDGVVMPDNDPDHCILWWDDEVNAWFGWDTIKKDWGKKYYSMYVIVRE